MKSTPFILIFFFLLFSLSSRSQIIEDQDEVRFPKSEFTVGINTNTVGVANGGFPVISWISGINSRYSRHITKLHYASFQLDIMNIAHPKEIYIRADSTSSLWIPFKLNYLYSIRPMVGWEFLFFRKERDEGLQMRFILAAGPSFGILKPNMILTGNSQGKAVTVPFSSLSGSVNTANIYGDRPFDGFNRAELVMGFNFKASVMLEFGVMPKSVSGIEVGFQYETFGKEIPLMLAANNSSYFTSAFLTIFFGARRY